MTDVFDFTPPFGWIGKCADQMFLRSYMTKLLRKRSIVIKETAEAGRSR